jgi:hypothetical protein
MQIFLQAYPLYQHIVHFGEKIFLMENLKPLYQSSDFFFKRRS